MRDEKDRIFVHLLARGLPHRYAEPSPGGVLRMYPLLTTPPSKLGIRLLPM